MPGVTVEQAMQIATERRRAGRLAEAEGIYRQVLQHDAGNAEAYHGLGMALKAQGRLEEAVECYRRAVHLRPDLAAAHNNLGNALHGLGRFAEAIECYRRAIALEAAVATAHNNLGAALQALGRFDAAIESYRRAVGLEPGLAEARNNLASALRERGKLDEAMECCQQAIALRPDFADARYNLANVLHDQGRFDEAIECYRAAIALRADYVEAYNNLSNSLRERDFVEESIECCRKAVALRAEHAPAHSNLGLSMQSQGRIDEAIGCYRKAIALTPDFAEAHSNLLMALHYHGGYDARAVYDEHLRWARQHAEPLKRLVAPHHDDPAPGRRLRLGYVSPDFRVHSVAFFIETALAEHDRGQFEVVCYSNVLRPDATTERLAGYADHWTNIVGVPDEQVAEQIRQDRIDILVDLAGHTADNRLRVFARKPAPVQVTYLGYPNTTGLSTMDYRLTDAICDPVGLTEGYHTEELIRLSPGFLCYRPPRDSPEVAELPARARGHLTFGSFNNLAKVTVEAIATWCSILGAVSGSCLMLKAKGLGDASTQRRLRQSFAQHGIDPARIEIHGPAGPLREHLGMYNLVDIALDTFPYNGTTTTCEALWMRTPVIALAGVTHVSRVGMSLLSTLGLDELVAATPEAYVATAMRLAGELERLREMRSSLRDRLARSPLMDGRAFTRGLEEAYRGMWRRWCAAPRGGSARPLERGYT